LTSGQLSMAFFAYRILHPKQKWPDYGFINKLVGDIQNISPGPWQSPLRPLAAIPSILTVTWPLYSLSMGVNFDWCKKSPPWGVDPEDGDITCPGFQFSFKFFGGLLHHRTNSLGDVPVQVKGSLPFVFNPSFQNLSIGILLSRHKYPDVF